MRVIRPARRRSDRFTPLALALGMLLVGVTALAVMAMLPPGREVAAGLLAVAAAMGLGIGAGMLLRAVGMPGRAPDGEDLARLLAPTFDDDYALIVSPRLPGVSRDLAGIIVGPAGVRALVARRWHGRYRVRGRGWQFDTHSSRGWIRCRTNPSFEAESVSLAVARWARERAHEPSLPIAPAVVFPQASSVLVLEEPDTEVVTTENAPWWASRIGRVQRMDPGRIADFVQAIMEASEATGARVPAQRPRRT